MIYTEMTPNPACLKFVTGRVLLPSGAADFPRVEDTTESPLAKKLFDFAFVEQIFIGRNFITLTKQEEFQWETIIPVVKDFLKGYFASEQPIVTGSLAEEQENVAADDDELTRRIKETLETYVQPSIASDGGHVLFEHFDNGVLHLRLQGSCSSCSLSSVTLKNGIETLMTRMIPEVKQVEAI